jgi:hypothetical protein
MVEKASLPPTGFYKYQMQPDGCKGQTAFKKWLVQWAVLLQNQHQLWI